MYDFMMAALPWVIIALALALMFANRKKAGDKTENYMLEGMCFGMCAGTVLGSMHVLDIGLGISLGMLLGEAIGYCIKKE